MRRSSNNIGATIGILGLAVLLVVAKFLFFYVFIPLVTIASVIFLIGGLFKK